MNQNKISIAIIFVFFLIYLSISLINHIYFRTFFDLGMINHALYQIMHLKTTQFTLGIDGVTMPFLATHFSPFIYIYAPLYLLFDHFTPTIVQILAIIFGGIGMYQYTIEKFANKKLANYVLVHFYLIWGSYSALAFDFHHQVIGAMFIPWIFLSLRQNRLLPTFLFSGLMLLCAETMGVYLFFILIGYVWFEKKMDKKAMLAVIAFSFFALSYSMFVIFKVMPFLQHSGQNLQFGRYTTNGLSVFETVLNLIKHPYLILQHLLLKVDGNLAIDKLCFWSIFTISGGFTLLKNPKLIVLLIPVFALKFLSNDEGFHSVYHQYSIEFVPIISFMLVSALTIKRKIVFMKILIPFTAIASFLTLNFSFGAYHYIINGTFYTKNHYQPELKLKEIETALKLIPNDISVSASSCLTPYLYQRDSLYQFPVQKNAEYLAIIKQKRSSWPLNEVELASAIQKLKSNNQYQVLSETDDFIILKNSKSKKLQFVKTVSGMKK